MNFISWTFIVAIIAITDSLAFDHDSREILTCHDVRPMKRFGANRALGVWYGFISRANSETAAKSCLKLNLISIGNNTLNSEVSYVDANGTVVSSQSSNQLLGLSQATFLSNKAVTLANGQNATIEIRSTTVYTDYNNILVVFSCGEYPDTRGLLTSYSVFVRSRGFNSLASLSKALDKLDDYVTLSETFSWIKNDATCQN